MDLILVTALFLIVALAVAIGILVVVALPHLRGNDEGSGRDSGRDRTLVPERHRSRTSQR